MKETSKRLIGGTLLTLAVLLLAVLCAVSCHTNGGNEETTLPDTIPVVPDDSGSATSDTEAVTDPATETDFLKKLSPIIIEPPSSLYETRKIKFYLFLVILFS